MNGGFNSGQRVKKKVGKRKKIGDCGNYMGLGLALTLTS